MKAIAARNRLDSVERAADEILPSAYAALALALHRKYKWGFTRIDRLFVESQEIWNEFVQKKELGGVKSMCQMCEQETGICVELIGRRDLANEDE